MWKHFGFKDDADFEEPTPPKRKILIKHCPVCRAIFRLDEEQKPLMVYCQECDTDYYFRKSGIQPYRAEVHALRKKSCGCDRCRSKIDSMS